MFSLSPVRGLSLSGNKMPLLFCYCSFIPQQSKESVIYKAVYQVRQNLCRFLVTCNWFGVLSKVVTNTANVTSAQTGVPSFTMLVILFCTYMKTNLQCSARLDEVSRAGGSFTESSPVLCRAVPFQPSISSHFCRNKVFKLNWVCWVCNHASLIATYLSVYLSVWLNYLSIDLQYYYILICLMNIRKRAL